MREVVEDLGIHVSYFKKQFLTKFEYYKDFPIKLDTFSLNSPDTYGKTFRIKPIDYTKYELYQDTLIGTFPFDSLISNAQGSFNFRIIGKLPINTDTTLLVQTNSYDQVTESILKKLKADFTDKNSTTVGLSLIDPLPERGIDLLNSLITKYNQVKIKENNENSLSTLSFIDERLGDVGRDLASVERSLEQYKKSNQITSEASSDLDIVLKNVDQLSDQRENIELDLSILNTMKLALNSDSREFDLIPISGSLEENQQINDLVKTYNGLVLERRQRLVTGQPNNPLVQSLTQKLNSLRSTIFSTFSNLEKDLNLELEMVGTQYDRSIEKLKEVPTQERQLVDRSRQQSIVENLYVYLLQKKEETAIALVGTQLNSNLIDPPHSTIKPVRPNKYLYYLGGLFGGLFIPFFILSIREVLSESVDKLKDMNRILRPYRTLGTIPESKGKDKIVMTSKERSVVADSFRYLRNNIQHYFHDKEKSILVTSSVSGEGKSFVAINLAASFALANKNTVILDFDMYKPQVANLLGENVEIGLKNYIAEDIPIEQILHKSQNVNRLSFIAGGKNDLNPADLIADNNKLEDLFAYLKSNFEIVIVDTPPVGIISDSFLLNDYITQTLFVIRLESTEKDMVYTAKDLFKQNKFIKPRFVINGIKKGEIYDYKY